MVFDYKKEYKEFYLPSKKPVIVEVPAMNYVAVFGEGNPNIEDGAYKNSIGRLSYGMTGGRRSRRIISMTRSGKRSCPNTRQISPLRDLRLRKFCG